MKMILFILVLCISGKVAGGQTNSAQTVVSPAQQKISSESTNAVVELLDCVESKPVGGLIVAFLASNTIEQLRRGAPLVFPSGSSIPFGFASVTNVFEVYRLDPEFGYRISAKSEDGKVVPPTRLGRRYGRKFDEVKGYDEHMLDWSREYYASDNRKARSGSPRPFRTVAAGPYPELQQILPPLDALFEFDKPGRYTVQIEVQCLSRPFPPVSAQFNVIKFPPVELKADHAESAK